MISGLVHRLPGLILTDYTFMLPLDHAIPDREQIAVFAREVVAAGRESARLPWLVFFQGGPGMASPRPTTNDGWLKSALQDHRVLLLDQRGTGQSTPVNSQTLARFTTAQAMADYLKHFRADSIIQVTEEVMKHTRIDVFWYWEDMAYNHAALIDPKMYRKFAFKHYRRVNDWLKSKGIRHIGLDSDGQISELIPIWVDSGITHLWPFEVQSGMDVLEVRKTYGRSLGLVGGIDKRACTHGFAEIHREVDRVMPLVEQGGYIPELDHSVPPNISWQNFIEYVRYVKHRLGRG